MTNTRNVDFWANLIMKHGLATVGLIFVCWQFVLPMRDGHLEFLKTVSETTKNTGIAVDSIKASTEGIKSSTEGIKASTEGIKSSTASLQKFAESATVFNQDHTAITKSTHDMVKETSADVKEIRALISPSAK